MTNAERIKNMTEEELQQFLCQISTCETCAFCKEWGCKIDEWLQQEANDD